MAEAPIFLGERRVIPRINRIRIMKDAPTTPETPPDKNADKRRDRRIVRPLRLSGKTFTHPDGNWIKIEDAYGDSIRYNCSGSIQWSGGRLRCSRSKMKKLLIDGGYLTNAQDQA